jgi:hypothetical protein
LDQVPLIGSDERGGKFLRPVHHNVMAAGDADELPGPVVLEARAELLERRRSPSGGKKYTRALAPAGR